MKTLLLRATLLLLALAAPTFAAGVTPSPIPSADPNACSSHFQSTLSRPHSTLLVCKKVPNLTSTDGIGPGQLFVVQKVGADDGQEEGEEGVTVSIYANEGADSPLYRESGLGYDLIPFTFEKKKALFATFPLSGGRNAWLIRTFIQPNSMLTLKAFDPTQKKFEAVSGSDSLVFSIADQVEVTSQSIRVLHRGSAPREFSFENGKLTPQ
jgi:hypothetical protein